MSPPATLLIWFQLRSPELAEDFERLMTDDRDIVLGSLDAISDWRLTQRLEGELEHLVSSRGMLVVRPVL